MITRPDHLPDYDAPPLNEVVLGIQFADLNSMSAIHAGLFWDRVRKGFDKHTEQPPLSPVYEVFGGVERAHRHQVMLELMPAAPMNRFWFINADDTELIQIQRDRFIHNWRKVSKANQYPHYEYIRRSFCDSVRAFEEFLTEERLGRLITNQCELSYINHIYVRQDEPVRSALHRVFTEWLCLPSFSEAAFEDLDFNLRFRLFSASDSSKPIGRLHISVQPAVQEQGTPMIVMTLTARGRPLTSGVDGCLAFMDLARIEIVERFTKLTSKTMHEAWGRKK